jgi:aspartyl-tRNA(Asn)/glutamyl-tRNA(Gln) amidotransferase subunit A
MDDDRDHAVMDRTPGGATELVALSVPELATALRTGRASATEVADAYLARIREVDPSVNAFCHVDEEDTRAQARAADSRFRAGAPRGPLDGIPVAIKDVVRTQGWPTLRGSRMVDPAGPWDDDSPVSARLREQGMVFLGKTTTLRRSAASSASSRAWGWCPSLP